MKRSERSSKGRGLPLQLVLAAALLAAAATTFATPVRAADAVGAEVQVLDGQGRPFPAGTGGVGMRTAPDAPYIVGMDHDGDGDAQIQLDPEAVYSGGGFATNTGWRDPDYVAPDGTTFHFGDPVAGVTVADIEGMTFVVARPTGQPSGALPESTGVAVEVVVLDELGKPFPTGTAGALFDCVAAECTPDTWFGSADADGVVRVLLDPSSAYSIGGMVGYTGWACGGWTGGDPDNPIWFSTNSIEVGSGAALHQPTEPLIIEEPDCSSG